MKELFEEFVQTLKKRFGKYDEEHKRFEKSSNSEIARELGYSDAQFSRLINESATEGEYQRANQNLKRVILIDQLEEKLDHYRDKSKERSIKKKFLALTLILIICCVYFGYLALDSHRNNPSQNIDDNPRDFTLQWAFETSFVKPYISLDDLPDDCNYPCYKYQGKWSLDNTYKLPFFREQNGYHYLATEVTMYARCMSEESLQGNLLEGYEYQKHEIWYDQRELPVDSFINDDGTIKDSYKNLKLSENKNFVRVANIHTLFRNQFVIEDSTIVRTGKVIGRDVEVTSEVELLLKLNEEQISVVRNNISRIANNRLEDFSKPVSCDQAQAPASDFNLVKDGDVMSYSCRLTTSRVALDYEKRYLLEDQYIKNTCRPSN